jgi:hypothetical protein
MKMFLLIAPKFDTATEFTFKWIQEVRDEIVKQNYDWVFLSDGVSRKDVEDHLKSEDVDTVIFYDHGSEDALWGSSSEKVIDTDNVSLLNGKDVYTLACLSGKKLGVEAWKRGCKTYIGYEEEFVFTTDEEDLFKECANSGILKKLRDKVSWKEAFNYMKQKYNECIEKAQSFWTKVWLAHDRDCLVKYDAEQYPETKCMFRKLAIKLFGERLGWKISLTLFLHVFLGILAGFFASIPILFFPIASLLIFLTFIIYEVIEEETEEETTKNILEFFVGAFIGRLLYIIVFLLHIF